MAGASVRWRRRRFDAVQIAIMPMLGWKSRSRFYPQPTGDPGRDRNARTLQFSCFLLAVAVGAVLIVSGIGREWQETPLLVSGVTGLVAAMVMNRAGRSDWAGRTAFLVALLTAILLVFQAHDGFRSHSMLVFPGLLLISLMMLNRAAYVTTAGIVVVAVAALGIAVKHGLTRATPPVRTTYDSIFYVDLNMLVIAIIGSRIARDTRSNVFDLRSTIDRVSKANLTLEETAEALRESEQQLTSIYNTVRDVIFHLAVEPEGRFRFVSVNAAFLRVTGLSREAVIGKTVNEVIPEPSLTTVLGKYRQAIEENTTVVWEETSDYPTGRLTGQVSVAPVFDNTGTCTAHLVGSVHDITGLTRAKEIEERLTSDLEHSRDEIRALAAGLMKAQEDERRRISGELHDQICHQLASLAIEIGELAVSPLPPEKTRVHIEAIRARLVQTSQETHHIAYQMHTAILDDLGLTASLKDLFRQFSERYPDIALDFEDNSLPVSVPREVASCLYRVAQEGLQNIAKHSHAKSASLRLDSRKQAIVLTIHDDGDGFDRKAVKGRGGLGLISMEERARSVNGKLTIASRLGHGTQLSLEVPLPVDNL